MEGRSRLVCGDCGRTCEVSGEMPDEYRSSFLACGFMPRPGAQLAMMCRECASKYEGSETRDDASRI